MRIPWEVAACQGIQLLHRHLGISGDNPLGAAMRMPEKAQVCSFSGGDTRAILTIVLPPMPPQKQVRVKREGAGRSRHLCHSVCVGLLGSYSLGTHGALGGLCWLVHELKQGRLVFQAGGKERVHRSQGLFHNGQRPLMKQQRLLILPVLGGNCIRSVENRRHGALFCFASSCIFSSSLLSMIG